MSDTITRRDFLKIAAIGAAGAAVLTGCGPTARYIKRQPYSEMPEYTLPGQSTFFATTCRECAAACGLIIRTVEGRAIKVEGNPAHPVNRGRTCSRAQAALQGLYNPDRLVGPQKQVAPGQYEKIEWAAGITAVKDALAGGSAAFLMGLAPDHLYDLAAEIALVLDVPPPLRYGALGMFDGRVTLAEAAADYFGTPGLPTFNIADAEVVFSFGANFAETWLSPVAYANDYGKLRQGTPSKRGYLAQFEPRLSLTAANADEWIPVTPGYEGLMALALLKLRSEPEADLSAYAATGVPAETLRRLARIYWTAERRVAIPGATVVGQTNGLEAARAVLALNAGSEAWQGMYITEVARIASPDWKAKGSFAELIDLVERMKTGQVKALFVHGVNPAFELPEALGFGEALKNVPTLISFASFPDETSQLAHYILPDHTPMEAWGYQHVRCGAGMMTLSGAQPVVVPLYDTKATADVLLAAVQAAGGNLAAKVSYADEVAFLQRQVMDGLMHLGGVEVTEDPRVYWTSWLQHGGFYGNRVVKLPETAPNPAVILPVDAPVAQFDGSGEYYLHVYPSPVLGDGSGANRPWLQETPDPMTTAMWNTWVEINPQTAEHLGVKDDDIVTVTGPGGSIEAIVYLYPAIRPDTVAIPFGQGHTAMGRYARGRGSNPLKLLGLMTNAAGDLAFRAVKVSVSPTGKSQKLARQENRVGVYGEQH